MVAVTHFNKITETYWDIYEYLRTAEFVLRCTQGIMERPTSKHSIFRIVMGNLETNLYVGMRGSMRIGDSWKLAKPVNADWRMRCIQRGREMRAQHKRIMLKA